MKTRKVKRRKFKFFKLILLLLFLYVLGYLGYLLFTLPINNIRILNTKLLNNDQLIIEQAKLDKYPSFLLTTSYSIKKNLLKNPYIKDVKVEKKLFGRLNIYITENEVVFYDKSNNFFVLENKEKVEPLSTINDVPILLNFVPDTIYDKLIDKILKVDADIKMRISEIEYKPLEVDKERFLLMLNDGNYVYLTLYKFEKINEYNKILPTLENKRGILYLDSGNYFEIFK